LLREYPVLVIMMANKPIAIDGLMDLLVLSPRLTFLL
jgi:hypothetical protein